MGIGDFFKSRLGRQNCSLCGQECGVMHRTKLRGDGFVCSDCRRKCSRFIRLSEMTQEEVQEHIGYMEKQEKLYRACFEGARRETFPSPFRKQAISFADDLGLFEILDRDSTQKRDCHELFRYDQVLSYEPYVEKSQPAEPGKPEEFRESGIKLRLAGVQDHVEMDPAAVKRGIHTHPYIRREIKVVFHTSEGETDYTAGAVHHFNHIFGVHDDERALLGFGMTRAEKRTIQGGVAAARMAMEAVRMAGNGGEGLAEEKQAALQGGLNVMSDAQTGGLAEYTRRADAAEAEAWNK